MCRSVWFYLPLALLATLPAGAISHDAIERQFRSDTPVFDSKNQARCCQFSGAS